MVLCWMKPRGGGYMPSRYTCTLTRFCRQQRYFLYPPSAGECEICSIYEIQAVFDNDSMWRGMLMLLVSMQGCRAAESFTCVG